MSFLSQPVSIFQNLFGVKRQIGNFKAFITTSEETSDRLTITKQPVQQGAMITDHAFKEPTQFSCQIFFAANTGLSLRQTYQDLLDLQNSRVPFEIVTPKRVYTSMLIATLSSTTDKTTENCLAIRLACEEIIVVKVNTVVVPRSSQKNPGATGKTEKSREKKSFIYKNWG